MKCFPKEPWKKQNIHQCFKVAFLFLKHLKDSRAQHAFWRCLAVCCHRKADSPNGPKPFGKSLGVSTSPTSLRAFRPVPHRKIGLNLLDVVGIQTLHAMILLLRACCVVVFWLLKGDTKHKPMNLEAISQSETHRYMP